jgi:hypothetical protein
MPRTRNICPPGILCITPSTIFFGVVILVLVCFIIYLIIKDSNKTTPISIQIPNHPIQQNPPVQVNVQKGDDRYTRAPKPLRNWLNPVDMDGTAVGSIPVIATRGLPEAYQSMGIVKTPSGELLPLYGRRVASRSDRFNYYTRTDTNNPIPLPINYKRRDCQDDIGCDELFDGENVEIIPTKQKGSVTIYRFNGPSYIPGLI